MLFLPELIPKALEELASRKDEDAQLVKEEEEWKAKLQAIRDYRKNTTPTGIPPKAQQEEEGADDDDEEMTEEEEEEEVSVMEEEQEEDEGIEEAEADDEGESEDLDFEQ